MGLNRTLLMGKNVDLKNIKAMMTVGRGNNAYFGFSTDGSFGSISPNPLPNGILVTECFAGFGMIILGPNNIAYCTINDIKLHNGDISKATFSFLQGNVGKTIPVIFHFD